MCPAPCPVLFCRRKTDSTCASRHGARCLERGSRAHPSRAGQKRPSTRTATRTGATSHPGLVKQAIFEASYVPAVGCEAPLAKCVGVVRSMECHNKRKRQTARALPTQQRRNDALRCESRYAHTRIPARAHTHTHTHLRAPPHTTSGRFYLASCDITSPRFTRRGLGLSTKEFYAIVEPIKSPPPSREAMLIRRHGPTERRRGKYDPRTCQLGFGIVEVCPPLDLSHLSVVLLTLALLAKMRLRSTDARPVFPLIARACLCTRDVVMSLCSMRRRRRMQRKLQRLGP